MIKNIIFDLGKVLIDYDFDLFFRACGFAAGEKDLAQAEDIIALFDAGKINKKQFYLQMRERFGINLTQTAFESAWLHIFWEDKEMLNLAAECKKRFPIYLLSNTDELHFPFVWQQFPSLRIFAKNLMLSYEMDCVKPELIIFQKGLEKFGLKPEESIFIDDRADNVEAARKIGITSICHRSCLQTKKLLEKYLKKEG
ncbi:MAG TPA: HAD family phosphatase [Candidatus Cloacimonadota bacterium]|nr:HAD family phosphatase [Candidatus Cloacimonadota bacterium]